MNTEPLPENWNESPKGCWDPHPLTREICQLPADGHQVHKRKHPNGTQLECWTRKPVMAEAAGQKSEKIFRSMREFHEAYYPELCPDCAHHWKHHRILGCKQPKAFDTPDGFGVKECGCHEKSQEPPKVPPPIQHLGMGTHDYPGCRGEDFFTSDCANDCGCWMGRSRSGGPEGVDPFGDCPKAAKKGTSP